MISIGWVKGDTYVKGVERQDNGAQVAAQSSAICDAWDKAHNVQYDVAYTILDSWVQLALQL